MTWKNIFLLCLIVLIEQLVGDDIRSLHMSIINNSQFQCVNTTCLPFVTLAVSNIWRCQMACLANAQCTAASFDQSTSNCQLFSNVPDPNGNMLAQMSIVTMIVMTESRIPAVYVNNDTLITFDDLTDNTAIPYGYYNMNWTNAWVWKWNTNTSGYYTATVSRPIVMFNEYSNPLTMKSTNNSRFTLKSAVVAAAWNDNLQLTIVGYRSNVVVINNTFILQVFTRLNLTFNGYSDLDKVIFITSGGITNANVNNYGNGTHMAMDNLCLRFI